MRRRPRSTLVSSRASAASASSRSASTAATRASTNLIQVNRPARTATPAIAASRRSSSSASSTSRAATASSSATRTCASATADRGLLRSLPEHWFNLATRLLRSCPSKLTATTNLKVIGATEDPNRLVEYRGSELRRDGPVNAMGAGRPCRPTDLVLDRLPPIAELSLGMTYTPTDEAAVRATVYNALMQHRYQPGRVLRLRAAPRVPAEPVRGLPRVPLGAVPVLIARTYMRFARWSRSRPPRECDA